MVPTETITINAIDNITKFSHPENSRFVIAIHHEANATTYTRATSQNDPKPNNSETDNHIKKFNITMLG